MPGDRDHNSSSQWRQDIHQDSYIPHAGDDDFSKFLELENEFSQFDGLEHSDSRSGLDTPMSRLAFGHSGGLQTLESQEMEMNMTSQHGLSGYGQLQQTHPQQFSQFPLYQHMPQNFHSNVPPTPVSAEMHAAKYGNTLDASGQIMFERQQASFTPLVSPAQTPLDNAWGMPDYVVEDDFFSPLTSPAIEAQQNFSSTNATASPVDLNQDPGVTDRHITSLRRGTRKKLNPSSRAVAAARSVKQSPATKPLTRRRQASMSSIPVDKIDAMLHESSQSAKLKPQSIIPGLSSEDSVSPEPLSEALMRPPPVPQGKSPSAVGQSQSSDKNAPATPATLMKMPGKQSTASASTDSANSNANLDVMEDILLPAAAAEPTSRPLPAIDTSVTLDDDQSTPTMSAKTPKLSANSTPRSAGVRTSSSSQENLSKPGKGGRHGKKRQSVSSAAISPALRPKISPSISPLVPNTGTGIPLISAETSALYLASKSNYQNILDGTHLPGVSYPDTLAENLSSKRTSHKIAEQGRRNRINLALKEIESLLPPSIMAAAARKEKNGLKEESGDAGEKATAAQGASKASTVEMAIVYIKSLQEELQETKSKLQAAEKILAENNSTGSQTTDDGNIT